IILPKYFPSSNIHSCDLHLSPCFGTHIPYHLATLWTPRHYPIQPIPALSAHGLLHLHKKPQSASATARIPCRHLLHKRTSRTPHSHLPMHPQLHLRALSHEPPPCPEHDHSFAADHQRCPLRPLRVDSPLFRTPYRQQRER